MEMRSKEGTRSLAMSARLEDQLTTERGGPGWRAARLRWSHTEGPLSGVSCQSNYTQHFYRSNFLNIWGHTRTCASQQSDLALYNWQLCQKLTWISVVLQPAV